MHEIISLRPAALALAVALVIVAAPVTAQHTHQAPPAAKPAAAVPAHGTPKNWKFKLPKGDAVKGREVFAKLECHACHEVRGESFPAPANREDAGPELSHMATMHPPEFFAESIVNPGAFVEPRYRARDGSSRMPSFNDSMTVQELIDLVAFLTALEPPPGTAQDHRH
jgi:mono/diheme cytochrome c family protein